MDGEAGARGDGAIRLILPFNRGCRGAGERLCWAKHRVKVAAGWDVGLL